MIMHPLGRVAALLFFMATIPALLLQGCIPLAITAAGGTALVATDRRSTGAQLDDEIIEDKIVATVVPRFAGPPGYASIATLRKGVRSQVRDSASQVQGKLLSWKEILDRGCVIGPARAAHAMRVRDMDR